MPFQRQAVTLFEMIPTPIIAVIMEGSVSKTSRGPSSEIPLNPCLLSIDPDFPDDKVRSLPAHLLCLGTSSARNYITGLDT